MLTKYTPLVISMEEKLVFLLLSSYALFSLSLLLTACMVCVFCCKGKNSLLPAFYTKSTFFGRLSFKWKLPSLSANTDSCFLWTPITQAPWLFNVFTLTNYVSSPFTHFETLSHKLYLDSVLNRITLSCSRLKAKIWTCNSLLLKLETHFLILCKQSKNVF